jgi:hypothetical protein
MGTQVIHMVREERDSSDIVMPDEGSNIRKTQIINGLVRKYLYFV